MTIRGIFFDAAGVLYYRPTSTDEYALNVLRERGFAQELRRVDLARHKALRSQANRGRLEPERYWDELLSMHGVQDPEVRKALVKAITDHSDQVLPVPGGREVLAALRRRGFVLGIVTDTIYPIEVKMRWLAQVGVDEFIDVVACSSELGAHKPEPALYLDAIHRAGLTPGESAFVGHDAGELEGARATGMATVAVNCAPETRADFYAESLPDLLNVPIFRRITT